MSEDEKTLMALLNDMSNFMLSVVQGSVADNMHMSGDLFKKHKEVVRTLFSGDKPVWFTTTALAFVLVEHVMQQASTYQADKDKFLASSSLEASLTTKQIAGCYLDALVSQARDILKRLDAEGFISRAEEGEAQDSDTSPTPDTTGFISPELDKDAPIPDRKISPDTLEEYMGM